MRRPVFLTLLCVAIALLTWAFSTSGKEGVLIFILGTAILLSMLAVGGLRLVGSAHHKRKTSATNNSAILGAMLGLFLGAVIGERSGFGLVMFSIFHPDLPERDFGTELGAIGGGLLGAFFLASLCGILQILIVRPEKVVTVADSKDSRSRGDSALQTHAPECGWVPNFQL